RGITVNSVSPGLTEDSVLNSFPQAAVDAARAWHGSGWTPMGRLGTPADIGNVVALLCSPDAGWVTGQLIYRRRRFDRGHVAPARDPAGLRGPRCARHHPKNPFAGKQLRRSLEGVPGQTLTGDGERDRRVE